MDKLTPMVQEYSNHLDYPRCWEDLRIPLRLIQVARRLEARQLERWDALIKRPMVEWQAPVNVGVPRCTDSASRLVWAVNSTTRLLESIEGHAPLTFLQQASIAQEATEILSTAKILPQTTLQKLCIQQDQHLKLQILDALGLEYSAAALCLQSKLSNWVAVYNWGVGQSMRNLPASARSHIEEMGALVDTLAGLQPALSIPFNKREVFLALSEALGVSARGLQELNAVLHLQLMQFDGTERLELLQLLPVLLKKGFALTKVTLRRIVLINTHLNALLANVPNKDSIKLEFNHVLVRTDWQPPKAWGFGENWLGWALCLEQASNMVNQVVTGPKTLADLVQLICNGHVSAIDHFKNQCAGN